MQQHQHSSPTQSFVISDHDIRIYITSSILSILTTNQHSSSILRLPRIIQRLLLVFPVCSDRCFRYSMFVFKPRFFVVCHGPSVVAVVLCCTFVPSCPPPPPPHIYICALAAAQPLPYLPRTYLGPTVHVSLFAMIWVPVLPPCVPFVEKMTRRRRRERNTRAHYNCCQVTSCRHALEL